MDEHQPRLSADGELSDPLPIDLGHVAKKKGRAVWHPAYRIFRFFIVATSVTIVTIFATLILTGKLDLNDYEWFRRLCLSTLGGNRLAHIGGNYSSYGYRITSVDTGRSCVLTNRPDSGVPSLQWFPDRKHLLLTNGRDTYIIDSNGANKRFLVRDVGYSTLSPDGKSLLYTARLPDKDQYPLYVTNLDGTDRRLLLEEVHEYRWSPDSQSILFTASSTENIIYRINVDGTDKRTLLTGAISPRWSPDGKYISFLTQTYPGWKVKISNPDGSSLQELTTVSNNGSPTIVWSPNSRILAFRAGDFEKQKLYIVNIETKSVNVIDLPYTTSLAWSPDSKYLAFIKSLTGYAELKVIGADGLNERLVRMEEVINLAPDAWQPEPSNK